MRTGISEGDLRALTACDQRHRVCSAAERRAVISNGTVDVNFMERLVEVLVEQMCPCQSL